MGRQRERDAGRRRRLACALSLLACGCGADPGVPGDDRYARSAMPIEREWRRESEIPRAQDRGMAMWEVSLHPPGTTPTRDERRAAEELIERSHRAVLARGWQDHEQALADGFHLMPHDIRHYQNDEFLLDDRILDPDRPEFLMYYPTPEGMALTGLMLLVRSPDERGPQVGGPLTVWHYHIWRQARCYRDGVINVGVARRDGLGCREAVASHRSPEMLHVWLVDRPGGPFATTMYLEAASVPGLLAKRTQERGY